jgi:acetyltransferase-like isoleucine patch superfamily enzyme
VLREVTVGDFSYFERNAEAIYTEIGKFCSIAANTRINALEHPIERITQHKVSYRPNEYFRWLGVDEDFRANAGKARQVIIGHDVWIGHGAVIMPGISDRQWRCCRRQCGRDQGCRRVRNRSRQPGQKTSPAFPA